MTTRTIAVLAFDGMSPFHLSIPCAVFGEDRSAVGLPKFDVRVCALEPGPLVTSAGFTLETRYGLDELENVNTIIVPSWRDPNEAPPAALLAALHTAHQRGACLVGLCLGSFVLAAAGVLNGRPATTHWQCADEFARRYPQIRVNTQVLYVDDGDVLTSAGVAAGIDCCLHLLRKWCGAKIAMQVARRMVVPPHRQGSQAQYIEQPIPVRADGERITAVIDWAQQHLHLALSLDMLAKRACMGRRTFTRRFRQVTGTAVGKWLLHQRLAMAQRLLETSNHNIDSVAERAGFCSALSLRLHFRVAFNISPSNYRREFRGR